jgi:pilus assembly protein CpaB
MRSRTLFLLAILMGLITTTLFIFTLNNQKPEATEKEIEKVDVVFAISAIQPNQVITEELVEVRRIPIDQKHEAAVQNIEDILNKIAITQIEENEILLQHRVQTIEDEKGSLSKKITEGSRGVSIGLNIVQSVSNLVEPEDYVDVIFTERVKKDKEEVTVSKQLLTNIRVLAIGQKITVSNEADEVVQYGEVTLEIAPGDTMKLVNAFESGNLHLILHSRIITE